MRIADHQLDAGETTDHQALEELPPVDLLLAERHGHAQDLAPAHPVDAGGDQHRCVAHLTILAHLFVTCVECQGQ